MIFITCVQGQRVGTPHVEADDSPKIGGARGHVEAATDSGALFQASQIQLIGHDPLQYCDEDLHRQAGYMLAPLLLNLHLDFCAKGLADFQTCELVDKIFLGSLIGGRDVNISLVDQEYNFLITLKRIEFVVILSTTFIDKRCTFFDSHGVAICDQILFSDFVEDSVFNIRNHLNGSLVFLHRGK